MKKTIKISAKELIKQRTGIVEGATIGIRGIGTELIKTSDGTDFLIVIDYNTNEIEKLEKEIEMFDTILKELSYPTKHADWLYNKKELLEERLTKLKGQ